MSLETAFIGDVHGEARALERLLRVVVPKSDRIVFLGDMVNRGPDSRQVLDLVLQLKSHASLEVILLAGNHDEAFFDVINGSDRENEFLRMGGAATIQSYVAPPFRRVFDQLRGAVPISHLKLIESQRSNWETDEIFASHQYLGDLNDPGGRFVVAGHYVQIASVPDINEHRALIDTGSGTLRHGRLTAFYWPSRSFDQVDAPLE